MNELPEDELPVLTVQLRLIDPEWKAEFVEGQNHAVNTATMYKMYDVEVEVLTLNLNTGGMRIRYPWPNKHRKTGFEMCSQDISISHFFEKYAIMERKSAQDIALDRLQKKFENDPELMNVLKRLKDK